MTFVPWGPVAVWGSTETFVNAANEGYRASGDDIRFSIGSLNRHLKEPISAGDIVSVRTGIRALPVVKDKNHQVDPLFLSKRFLIYTNNRQQAITVYGGKITTALLVAESIQQFFQRNFHIQCRAHLHSYCEKHCIEKIEFAGYSAIIPEWSVENEFTLSIEDYLRRRTNLAQWIDRGGLGKHGEFSDDLLTLCLRLHQGNEAIARRDWNNYLDLINTECSIFEGL